MTRTFLRAVCVTVVTPPSPKLTSCVIVYRANHKAKSDADILRDAKLEAMGLPPQEDQPRRSNNDKVQMATDEVVSINNFRSLDTLHIFLRSWNASRNACGSNRMTLYIYHSLTPVSTPTPLLYICSLSQVSSKSQSPSACRS